MAGESTSPYEEESPAKSPPRGASTDATRVLDDGKGKDGKAFQLAGRCYSAGYDVALNVRTPQQDTFTFSMMAQCPWFHPVFLPVQGARNFPPPTVAFRPKANSISMRQRHGKALSRSGAKPVPEMSPSGSQPCRARDHVMVTGAPQRRLRQFLTPGCHLRHRKDEEAKKTLSDQDDSASHPFGASLAYAYRGAAMTASLPPLFLVVAAHAGRRHPSTGIPSFQESAARKSARPAGR